MNCLRCGRETENHQIFCKSCLEMMERYPVKSDVAVHLPTRKAPSVPRHPPKKEKSPEEKIFSLHHHVLRLSICLALTLLLLVGTIAFLFLSRHYFPNFIRGQNYKTPVTVTTSISGE